MTDDPAAVGGKYGSADIVTQKAYKDFRAHLEFYIAKPGGNSGMYLQNRFEIQVLDSFQNITYPDGQASAMYGQFPPMVNASGGPLCGSTHVRCACSSYTTQWSQSLLMVRLSVG